MYRVSGKQLAAIVIISVLVTAGIIAFADRIFHSRDKNSPPLAIEPTVIADPSVASEEQNNIEIYRSVSNGVVNITSRGYTETWYGIFPSSGSGSGSIIDERGYILTNSHVVQGAQQLEVQIGSEKLPARVVGTDPDNDLAVIKITPPQQGLTIVKLGTSQGLQVGQKVLAIGNPFGFQSTLTTGIISGLQRPVRDPATRRTLEGAIQTDASINPGNSGGPLLNSRGEMIGINTAIVSPSGGSVGIGFAVPVDVARKIIPDLIEKGYVPHPWLGVNILGPLNRNIAKAFQLPVSEGLIFEVYPRSGAATAGLRSSVVRETVFGGLSLVQLGDVLMTIDSRDVRNTDELQRALKDKEPGQTVQVEVLRQGRRMTLPVRLGERPHQER
jgi:putative serine protease PepD